MRAHLITNMRTVLSPGSIQLWLRGGLLILILATLTLAVPSPQPARAHSSINVDGNTDDWCYPGLATTTPDIRRNLTCTGSISGTEVLWQDGTEDTQSGYVDVMRFATTCDDSTLYFVGEAATTVIAGHAQVAIDVAPGGNNAWFNPGNAPLGQVGFIVGIAPDYLVTSDFYNDSATLWVASGTGSWNSVGTFSLGKTETTFEVGIPWSSFDCSGCPSFSPGDTALITIMATVDGIDPSFCGDGIPGRPCSTLPEDDLISEADAGTYTTTDRSCSSGSDATACELADAIASSADAFISVTYGSAGATRVSLQHFSARASQARLPGSWALALPVAALAMGAVIWLRRERRR